MPRYRRKKRRPQEPEVDEVTLTDYWSVQVTRPKPGQFNVHMLCCGSLGCTVCLRTSELADAGEGFKALAEVLEEALAEAGGGGDGPQG